MHQEVEENVTHMTDAMMMRLIKTYREINFKSNAAGREWLSRMQDKMSKEEWYKFNAMMIRSARRT